MSYQDAELLRDRNGNPIPQYFNISTGEFEPITKDSYDPQATNELSEIKQQQQEILTRLDSPIDTQVTGSNVELINSVEDTSDGRGSRWFLGDGAYYGTTGSPVLDVSKYNELFIIIENIGDVANSPSTTFSFYAGKSGAGEGTNAPYRYKDIDIGVIEAGSILTLESRDFPDLKGVLIGCLLRSWGSSENASLKITFWGRKY